MIDVSLQDNLLNGVQTLLQSYRSELVDGTKGMEIKSVRAVEKVDGFGIASRRSPVRMVLILPIQE